MTPASKRRKTAAAKDNSPPPPAKKVKPVSPLDIKQLYRHCTNDEKVLRTHVEQGTVEEAVWPILKAAKSPKDKDWEQACYLLALLVTNMEGKPSVNFCSDDKDTLSQVVETLLAAGGDAHKQHHVAIHFCILLLVATDSVRQVLISQLAGVELLHFLPKRRLELELKKSAGLRRGISDAPPEKPKRMWVAEWINNILGIVEGKSKHGDLLQNEEQGGDIWTYLHRSGELLIDLLSAFETRQYLVLYLDAVHFVVRCKMALKACPPRSHSLLRGLLSRIFSLIAFPVQVDKTALTKADVVTAYHSRATIVQKMSHRYYPDELQEVIYAGVGLLCNGKFIDGAMSGLSDDKLLDLLARLRLVEAGEFDGDRQLMLAILVHYVSLPPYPLDQLKSFPLYPTESVLFDHNAIPPGTVLRKTPVLAVSKLHTQFLSFQDYLLRNFELIRLESAYDIRSDIVDVVKRVKPVARQVMEEDTNNDVEMTTEMTGWARMALELAEPLRIMRVTPPKLGEGVPAQVVADLTIDLVHCGESIRKEWDTLGEFDNLFLVTIDASKMTGGPAPLQSEVEELFGIKSKMTNSERRVPDDEDSSFPERFGVVAIRGCMILTARDEDSTIISNHAMKDEPAKIKGTKRILRVQLDSAQYAIDSRSKGGTDVYQTLNLVVRRHGKENNFKSILETIRGLMEGSGSISRVIPPWLQPVILGYGDPAMANYASSVIKSYATKTPGVNKPDAPLDFHDTFLDRKHLEESFPDSKVSIEGLRAKGESRQNYRLTFKDESMKAASYEFPSDIQGNPVRFTPVQVEAIKSGLSLGLSLIVGPPGTGKSDVAVQIIANLYHSFPNQRTVIVTHSNAALNDLFEKIMARGDIDERYMIRLGSGERDLDVDSTHDFTRAGRVSHSLAKRGQLLEKVQQLSESLGISGASERGADGSPSYTCQSAGYFQSHYIKKRVDAFNDRAKDAKPGDVIVGFPFAAFFQIDQSGLLKLTVQEARAKIESIEDIFSELEEYRPLELLRSQRQRVDYFLMKQAKIVAMTCTHAAIARSRLIGMDFQYDNVVMEEAGQMTEVETFIPLVLQRGETNDSSSAVSRLKRVCLIGDHHQLPPVIKNMAFARFSNLDQSMFARLIGFGAPHIQLNKQGRTRPNIANLFRWKYEGLGDLQHVVDSPQFQVANAGFVHSHQIVNVENYEGKGETAPSAGYYQNVGEAEYAVALFQYMVLIGHPAEKISILTTYNGQKALITDILRQRCGKSSAFAGIAPRAVSTVDQYQGQQNDCIILSLVRTTSIGYLRDMRRMVVAVSRARLGLYILCRQSLFASSHELSPVMAEFESKPSNLEIVLGEHHPTERKEQAEIVKTKMFEVKDVAHLGSIVHSMQEEWVKDET